MTPSLSMPSHLPARLLAAALALAPSVAAAQQPAARTRLDPTAPAETQYQNVKVLKGVSAGEFHDAMDYMEGALGVGCSYCHVRGFEKDDKPEKEVARQMMRMVEAINRENFEGKPVVTCATCHQGRPKPMAVAALEVPPPSVRAFLPDRSAREEPAASEERGETAAFPPPGPVVERFVSALGGRPALAALQGLRMEATQGEGERAFALGLEWRPPASLRTSVTLERRGRTLQITQGSDGRNAWRSRNQAPAEDLHGLDLAQALRDAELLPSWVFSRTAPELETLGTGKIDDQPVVVLRLTAADGLEERLYFDAASGLLLRRAYEIPTPLGPVPQELDYSDWREEAGVLLPHRIVTRAPGHETPMTIDRVEAAAGPLPSTRERRGG